MKTQPPPSRDFTIIIRYPVSYGAGAIHGTNVKLWYIDGENCAQPITTCGALSVYADANRLIWAEAELFATEDGKPIFQGEPVMHNNETLTKIFTCHVREIQSRPSFTAGYDDAYEYLTGKGPSPQPLRMRSRKAVKT